jgi:hypothetical protein
MIEYDRVFYIIYYIYCNIIVFQLWISVSYLGLGNKELMNFTNSPGVCGGTSIFEVGCWFLVIEKGMQLEIEHGIMK